MAAEPCNSLNKVFILEDLEFENKAHRALKNKQETNYKRGSMKPSCLPAYDKLQQELRYILLVYHRNNNQHRAAIWWKQFNELKRNTAQVVELLQAAKLGPVRLTRLFRLLQKFLKKQVARMYYSFNGVIGLGQFVTLGVVLVGILARVYAAYCELYQAHESEFVKLKLIHVRNSAPTPIVKLQALVDEELGEEVDIAAPIAVSTTPLVENSTKSGNSRIAGKSKKKSKKKKSAIDDIFG